jgi:dipeptidyl-peptidase 4
MTNKKYFILVLFNLILSSSSFAQLKKDITLEDLWIKGVFQPEYPSGFNWMKNDLYYTNLEPGENAMLTGRPKLTIIKKYDVVKNEAVETIVDLSNIKPEGEENTIDIENYSFSPDERKVLVETETDRIYRRSSKSRYYLYDLSTKKLRSLSSGKQSYADFSPDGMKVAFVRENNLFYIDLPSGKEIQVTSDGINNEVINGSTDWVYEEEFEFTKAFFWSPDGSKLAFYRFNEKEVKEYNMQLWTGLYPEDYRFKYPKAGEKNSEIKIKLYDIATSSTKEIDLGNDKDIYIPRIKWADKDRLSILRMNRHQNFLEIILAGFSSTSTQTIYSEKNDAYIEINDDLTFLKDGAHFVLTSEKDGYRHIYKYDMKGNIVAQLTKGNWEVDKFLGVDESKGIVYYTSSEVSPLERHLYRTDLTGKSTKKLSRKKGTHEIEMSSSFRFYLDNHSTANSPNVSSLHESSGKELKVLSGNAELKNKISEYKISPVEFFDFTIEDGTKLNAYMIKPLDFDPSKKYPVFITIYGGPGSQSVTDGWSGTNYFWFQMLAQKGYLVVSVDNRGTGGRGAAFKKITQFKLGQYETQDMISTSKYLGELKYVDKSRIGIFGWSFGGYLSSLAITVGTDYFKAAIAVAPVISWRFYDTIYTERFLGLPSENATGYDNNSPISHANKLKGKYLLIHGTADDNVHFQNSIAMQDALIKANKQFDSFFYPNKNHGIYGGITRYHLYNMMSDFIIKNL